MKKLLSSLSLVFAVLCSVPQTTWAGHTETIIGAAIGGGAGAAIGRNMGGRDNAIIWSAIGGATGAAIGGSIGERHHDRVIVRERPVYYEYEDVEVHRYYPQPRQVYYAPSEYYRDHDHHYAEHRRHNRHHRRHHDDDDDDD